MPPRLPRAALQQSSYKCPSCTANRSFTQSIVARNIGPESPRFIEVPEPPQQNAPEKRRIRGVLPVPRDIFAGSAPGRGIDKADPERLAESIKEPTKQRRAATASDQERLAWKERMAELRRKNLREGIEALKQRKVKTDAFLSARGKRRQSEREAMLHRPEREDERLTNPSVDPVLQQLLEDSTVPDPNREARLAAQRERVAQKAAIREQDRADALHDLYLNARTFITTEEQLNAAIDDEFGTPENPRVFKSSEFSRMTSASSSVWAYGKPDSVQDLLNRSLGRPVKGGAMSSSVKGRSSQLTKERVARIAEELTGGSTAPDA